VSSAFILCIEPGRLESQAILLCRSIRKFAGSYRDNPIHAFSPREGFHVSEKTAKTLSDLNVEIHQITLNKDFPHYPIGNKIFTCAYAETHFNYDTIVFLDSDTIIINEPSAINLPKQFDVAVRPVDSVNRGSTGKGSRHEDYWLKMYSILDVNPGPMVRTVTDNSLIRAYFNAGLIITRTNQNIFSKWKANFIKLMSVNHVTSGGILNNMDQLSLAGTLAINFDKVKILDWRYNYPFGKRPILPKYLAEKQLEDLVHVHYHRWFHHPHFLDSTQPPINLNGKVAKWLRSYLPLEPKIDGPIRFIGAASCDSL
jgi:hypothetical protein